MDTNQALLLAENRLKSGMKYIPFENEWRNDFPQNAGVYVIWMENKPVYVGETSGIYSRMGDLMRPVNHAFTKKIGNVKNISDLGLLRDYIAENYKVSFIEVDFGRAEIEEFLILRWRKTLINKPTKRLLKGQQYSWVQAV